TSHFVINGNNNTVYNIAQEWMIDITGNDNELYASSSSTVSIAGDDNYVRQNQLDYNGVPTGVGIRAGILVTAGIGNIIENNILDNYITATEINNIEGILVKN